MIENNETDNTDNNTNNHNTNMSESQFYEPEISDEEADRLMLLAIEPTDYVYCTVIRNQGTFKP